MIIDNGHIKRNWYDVREKNMLDFSDAKYLLVGQGAVTYSIPGPG